jgi:MFS family permease
VKHRPGWYAPYVVTVLSLGTALNYYDRTLMGILVPAIKADLHLSDGQIGLLSGLAFVSVYCLLGIPIAQYADRGQRVRVLAASLAFWSIMTSLCGFAVGFGSLFLARCGVGVGEAGGLPTTQAIVSEYSPSDWKVSALALPIFASGIGQALAAALGGVIADRLGWRFAFWIAGIPGVLLALLVIATVRSQQDRLIPTKVVARGLPLRTSVKTLMSKPSLVLLFAGLSVASIGVYGGNAWAATFLMRTFKLSASTVGPSYAAVAGPVFMVGSLLGGLLPDLLPGRHMRSAWWVVIASFALNIPFSLAFFFSANFGWALVAAGGSILALALYPAPTIALIQQLSGPRLRATGVAVFLAITNLVGLGLGPYIIGQLSDRFDTSLGSDSLRPALTITVITSYCLGVVLLIRASQIFHKDTAFTEQAMMDQDRRQARSET